MTRILDLCNTPEDLPRVLEKFDPEDRIKYKMQWLCEYLLALSQPPGAATIASLFTMGSELVDGNHGFFNNVLDYLIEASQHATTIPGMEQFSHLIPLAKQQKYDGRADIQSPRVGWEDVKL
jgi:hypothetical protein